MEIWKLKLTFKNNKMQIQIWKLFFRVYSLSLKHCHKGMEYAEEG